MASEQFFWHSCNSFKIFTWRFKKYASWATILITCKFFTWLLVFEKIMLWKTINGLQNADLKNSFRVIFFYVPIVFWNFYIKTLKVRVTCNNFDNLQFFRLTTSFSRNGTLKKHRRFAEWQPTKIASEQFSFNSDFFYSLHVDTQKVRLLNNNFVYLQIFCPTVSFRKNSVLKKHQMFVECWSKRYFQYNFFDIPAILLKLLHSDSQRFTNNNFSNL